MPTSELAFCVVSLASGLFQSGGHWGSGGHVCVVSFQFIIWEGSVVKSVAMLYMYIAKWLPLIDDVWFSFRHKDSICRIQLQ